MPNVVGTVLCTWAGSATVMAEESGSLIRIEEIVPRLRGIVIPGDQILDNCKT